MTVDHVCKVRRCVNPDHLRLLDNFENARRTSGRDWPLGQCRQGHPDSNLIITSEGRRRCAVCYYARTRGNGRGITSPGATIAIRCDFAQGATLVDLAAAYQMKRSSIASILTQERAA